MVRGKVWPGRAGGRRATAAQAACKGEGSTAGWGQGMGRGAHVEHVDHGRDAGGVEAQRLVERLRILSRVGRRACGVGRGAEAWEAGGGGRPRCKQRAGEGSAADWGQGTRGVVRVLLLPARARVWKEDLPLLSLGYSSRSISPPRGQTLPTACVQKAGQVSHWFGTCVYRITVRKYVQLDGLTLVRRRCFVDRSDSNNGVRAVSLHQLLVEGRAAVDVLACTVVVVVQVELEVLIVEEGRALGTPVEDIVAGLVARAEAASACSGKQREEIQDLYLYLYLYQQRGEQEQGFRHGSSASIVKSSVLLAWVPTIRRLQR